MNKIIILDLDDTLINTQLRHFNVISEYINQFYNSFKIDFNQYVKLKKFGRSNIEILKLYEKKRIDHFKKYWLLNIESSNMLRHDKQIIDNNILLKIKNDFNIDFKVISLRTNKLNALSQVKSFSFINSINNFYFLPHNNVSNPKDLFIKNMFSEKQILYFIGDSYSDYEAATANNITFIQVETGFKQFNHVLSFDHINNALNTLFK